MAYPIFITERCQMKRLPPDSPQPTPIVIKLIFMAGSALAFYLFVMASAPSSRGYGGPGGWGDGIVYLVASFLVGAMVIWGFITWLAYRAMRASGRKGPIRAALWILFLPLILLIATMVAGGLGSIFSGG